MKETFDQIFDYISNLAHTVSESRYIKEMGLGDTNPYVVLFIVGGGIYFIFLVIRDLYKKHKFIKNKREAIKYAELTKEIEKKEKMLELQKKNKELVELRDLLDINMKEQAPADKGITKEDLATLINEMKNTNQGPSPEEIKKQIMKEIEEENKKKEAKAKKEAKKETKKEKEEKPKTKVVLKPVVKEITIPIPKINIQNPEDELPDGPIPNSVLEKDGITSSDSDRVSISEAYQESIEEKANIEEIKKDNDVDSEEKAYIESTKEIPMSVTIEEINNKEEIPDKGPMEVIEYEEPIEEESSTIEEQKEEKEVVEEIKEIEIPKDDTPIIEDKQEEEEELDPLEQLRLKQKQRDMNKKRVQDELNKRA